MNDPIITCSSGEGKNVAISVIRVGGFASLHDFQVLFTRDLNSLKPREVYLSRIICPNDGLVDEVTVVFFPEPNSYSGENILEIYAHGNRLTVKKIINLFRKNKLARLADPGEFTKRALSNKKLTLSQVEGLDLVLNAKNKVSLTQGLSLLSGGLNKEYEKLIDSFEVFRSSLEVEMDFSADVGEEISRANISQNFQTFSKNLKHLYAKANLGKKHFGSLNIGLFGLPNAGKSTFFNSILKRNRAIISEIKGTTRDYITEYIEINDEEFGLIDTAGLRETEDKIEALGVRSSYEFFSSSFFKVLLISCVELREFTDFDLIKDSDLIIFTKCKNIEYEYFQAKFGNCLKNKTIIFVDKINDYHGLFLCLLNNEVYEAFLRGNELVETLGNFGPIGPA
ncbi:MAG: hypothetical protein CME61_05430, partial [Halobacteriovoraceae bacterium]|nr:hypothetical protein [Halobacteriovoraceae bacterium]